ncbi:hypothetical protein FNL56_10450 [Tardiphaga sp. vice304]|uniref:hypothetical protein n=1 Tax=Tardiphaga sp. vice304 TaxID=2592817 RepID=UPI001162A672|nr:hypothetical protein [Tardiphaga sp. vice304]QDM26466.1 hypothetical protein FNL56_10450 [Tardiphaga sp. vice304]
MHAEGMLGVTDVASPMALRFEQDFRFMYLLVVSAIIFLVFSLLKMLKYRASWYFSISAPGAFILPAYFAYSIIGNWPNWYELIVIWLKGLPILMFLFPVFWIFPIILAKQICSLRASRFVLMNLASLANCAVLVGLYVWCDVARAFVIFYIER